MRDGETREIRAEGANAVFAEFLTRYQPTIVMLSGPAQGTEYTLDHARVTLGRGPGVDLAFEDSAMSREHAAIEFVANGFRLRDQGSTNGTLLNGAEVRSAAIKHGDKFQLGEHLFQFVIEERQRQQATYVVGED